ncbi:MAG: cupredoxin family copper-binding protein [Thermomicrobiales bacterium]|nr:cupredoxin family copper-binding protein [Thermomicrobiales bacterium]
MTQSLARRRPIHAGVLTALSAVLLLVTTGALAQGGPGDHPLLLLDGHCGATTAAVTALADVDPGGSDVAPTGSAAAIPLDMRVGHVDASLQSLLASDHALVVQSDDGQPGRLLACGDIGGVVRDGRLAMGLAEVDGSGYNGVAILSPDSAGATVTLYLMQHLGPQRAPLPTVTVDIKGFAYNPKIVEVPAGGSVTWTNNDSAPHTVTGLDGAIPRSGGMPFGASFTQVFPTPGTYDYICAYHPNMKGTVVVK